MLKLIKLSLKGFGCFKDEKIFEYDDGINIIRAENGSGKTTQINAISILLLSEYEGSFSDYMNRECNEFTISLEFMLNGKYLLETLTCKKGKSYTTTRNLKDLDTDTDLANGEGVKEWLNENGNLPVATSKYALFVRQNSDMDIIHCSDSERRDLFKKIQDLDYTKEIKILIEPKIEQTKEKIIENDKEIFALENKTYSTKDFVELPFTEDEYKLKKSQMDKLIAEKSLIEEKNNQLNDLKERKNKIESEMDSIDSSIDSKYHKIISEYKSFNLKTEQEKIEKEFANKKLESENKIKSLEEQKKNLDKDINEKSLNLECEIKKIEDEGNELVKEIDSIRLMKLIKFDENSLVNARNTLSELKTKSSIAWKNAEQLANGVCPICGGSCTDKHAQFESEAKEYDKQIAESENTINDLLQKKADIDEKAKKNEELKERKNNLSNELVKKQSLIENKRIEQKSLNSSLMEKKQNYSNQIESEKRILESIDSEKTSRLNSVKEKADLYESQTTILEKEIEDLKIQRDSKFKEFEELSKKIESFSVGTFDENKIVEIETELKKYDSVVAENKVVKEYNEQLEETKKEDKKELEKFKERKQKFEKEKFDLENSKKILTTDYPSWAILQNLKNIENDINEFIDQVYYKPLNIKFDMTRSGISMRFGDDIKVERLSGAEKAITNIGFCESFNKNLNLNMILLDEPDAPLSATRKEMFYSSLLEMKDVFEQMIVVTHSKDMVAYIQANDTDCNIIAL
jgi:exonuclease SbcC